MPLYGSALRRTDVGAGPRARIGTPPAVSGLRAWYRLDAVTGLADAAPILTLADSSTSGKTLTPGGADVDRPTYRTGVVNSLPVARFDGVWNYLGGTSLLSNTAFTLLVVLKPAATATNRAILSSDNVTDVPAVMLNAEHKIAIDKVGTANVGTGAVALSTSAFSVVAASYASAATWAIHVNGALDSGGATAITMNSTAATPYMVGRQAGSFALSGDIAELVAYDGVLSAPNRVAVTGYLGAKYGIAVT